MHGSSVQSRFRVVTVRTFPLLLALLLLLAPLSAGAIESALAGLTSSTHPDPATWYADNDPSFEWTGQIPSLLNVTPILTGIPLFADDIGFPPSFEDVTCVDIQGDTLYVGTTSAFHSIDISNETTPSPMDSVLVVGGVNAIEVVGNVAYAVGDATTLTTVDVSNPAAMSVLQSAAWAGIPGKDVVVRGNIANLACGVSGFVRIDVTDPTAVAPIDSLPVGSANTLAPRGTVFYVGTDTGLVSVDASSPISPPVQIDTYATAAPIFDVEISGAVAYVAETGVGVDVFDISSSTITLAGVLQAPAIGGIDVWGDALHLSMLDATFGIADVSDPSAPRLLESAPLAGPALGSVSADDVAYVTGGIFGIQVVDVADTCTPTSLDRINPMGQARDVTIDGDVAYIAAGISGMASVDISDPSNLHTLDTTATAVNDIVIQGDLAYGASGSGGLRIFDVSDPSNITRISRVRPTLMNATSVAVDGGMAYVGTTNSMEMLCIDVSDPFNPSVVGTSTGLAVVNDMEIEGNFLYAATSSGLRTIDVSDPTSPVLLDTYDTRPAGMGAGAMSVDIEGDVAYVADEINGLVSIDISDPSNLSLLDIANNTDYSSGVAVAGNTAYLADEAAGVRIMDVTDPSAMSEIGSFGFTATSYFEVTVSGEIVWASQGGSGLRAVQTRIVPEGYSYTLDTVPVTVPDAAVDTSASSVVMTDTADGLNYFHVVAADGSVTSAETLHRAVRIDTTPPNVNAVAVPDGSVPPTYTVTITSDDGAGSGISGTYYRLDGGAPQLYTLPFDITTPGDHEVVCWATDNVGLVGLDILEIYVDEEPPVTSADFPAGWQSSDVTVTLTAADADSDVAVTYYTIDGGPTIDYGVTGPFVVSDNGAHELTYWSEDTQGNVEAPNTAYVLIDTAAPTVSDDAPTGWLNADVLLTIQADDGDGSGVASIDTTITDPPPGGSTTTATVASDVATYTITAEGTTTVAYSATDEVGNRSATASTMVRIDKIAPVTTDDVPVGWQSTDVTITLSATDDLSGVAATYYDRTGYGPQLYTGPFVVSDEGETDITYWSVDEAGNVEQAKRAETVRVDKSDPVLAAYSVPATGWASGAAFGGGDAYDVYSYVHSIWYSIDAGPFLPQLGDTFIWTTSAEGTTRIDMYARDAAGNTSATETVTLRVDSTPPVTTDDAPGAWVSTDVTVTLTATDPLPGDGTSSGVATTYYRIDGSSTQTYTAPVPVTAEGTHEIVYWSVDGAGNTEEPNSATVRIDRTGPVVTDDSTPGWQQGPVTVTFTEADAGADASVFHYTLDGSPAATTAASMEVTGTGLHEIVYWGVDSLGNAGPLGHATLRIDDDPPMSASDIDAAWQQGPVDVAITATDAHSGVASIEATVTDPPPSGVTTRSVASETMTFTLSAEGTTTVEYFATDEVGNVETPTVEIVRIDDTAPTVSISPTSTQVIDAMTFILSATDMLSGVDAVYLSVDGGATEATDTVRLDTVGDHTITYWAVDTAGNESAHLTHDVRVSPSATTYAEVAGADRYLTSVEASKRSFPAGADAVIVATGQNWPDALGGAALAGVYDAPVLLTRTDDLPDAVASEIVRLDPGHVFVLGGTGVVSEAVEAQIRSLVVPTANLERFWGADRYITTEIIARRVIRDAAVFDGTAFLATGLTFPDALGAAPLSTSLERPLYLAGTAGISPAALAAMVEAGVTHVVILGGTGAVPAAVETQLDTASITHERLEGTDRYGTAIEVAKHGVDAGLTWNKVGLSSGTLFPDALTGGVMQGHDSSVMVLTNGDVLDWRVRDTLQTQRDIIGEVRFIGGAGALSQSVRDDLKQVLR